MICTPRQIYFGDNIKNDKLDESCNMYEKQGNAFRV